MLRNGLRQFGVVDARPRRVRAGNNNEHWFVGPYVLRRYRAGRPVPTVRFEHAVLKHLSGLGWPVAAPLAAPNGDEIVSLDGGLYALFPRLRGRRGVPERPHDPAGLGRMLARLHADLAGCPASVPEGIFAPVLSVATVWRNGAHTVDELLLDYQQAEPALAHRCALVLADLRLEAAGLDTTGLTRTLIHGDWNDGNLLYRRGAVTGVLDFDFAHPGLRIADLATSTLLLSEDDAASFVRAYTEIEALPVEELALLHLHERARCLGAVAAVLSIQRNTGASMLDRLFTVVTHLTAVEHRWPSLRQRILTPEPD